MFRRFGVSPGHWTGTSTSIEQSSSSDILTRVKEFLHVTAPDLLNLLNGLSEVLKTSEGVPEVKCHVLRRVLG